jgi:hypothetical protein
MEGLSAFGALCGAILYIMNPDGTRSIVVPRDVANAKPGLVERIRRAIAEL